MVCQHKTSPGLEERFRSAMMMSSSRNPFSRCVGFSRPLSSRGERQPEHEFDYLFFFSGVYERTQQLNEHRRRRRGIRLISFIARVFWAFFFLLCFAFEGEQQQSNPLTHLGRQGLSAIQEGTTKVRAKCPADEASRNGQNS